MMKVKKQLKSIISILLIAVLSMGIFAGCKDSKKTENENKVAFNEEGFPLVDESTTLTFVASRNAFHNEDYNDMLIFQEYEKLTNVKIDWTLYQADNLSEKKGILLASGKFPDVFYNMSINSKEATKYGSQGVFIPLNDLIEKYAPNVKKALDSRNGSWSTITCPDGNIYVLPALGNSPQNSTEKAWINKKWLDKLGLEMPTTTDELYNVLKAFKTQDPNGNGKADEVPLSGKLFNRVQSFVHGMYGIANSGSKIIYQYMDKGEDGKVRYFPMSSRYKEAVGFMRKLYSEGLLDREIFTMTQATFMAKGEQNIVGMFAEGNSPSLVGAKYKDDYVPLPVLEGPHGDKLWSNTTDLITFGSFAISSQCKNPELAMRWVDYWYSDEGNRLLKMGVEGETYRTLDNGDVEYLEHITNNPNGLSIEQAVGEFSVAPGGTAPGYNLLKYNRTSKFLPQALEAVDMYKPYMPKEIWQFTYTQEEVEELTTLNSDINGLTGEKTAAWVSGKESLDTYDDYIKLIKKLNVKRFIEIYQNAYDRWKKASK